VTELDNNLQRLKDMVARLAFINRELRPIILKARSK